MIEVQSLTKLYGSTVAVDDLNFSVPPGKVTGFLGPNGAGKSTTLRLIVGLDQATSGRALIDGRPYHEHRRPLDVVGTLLESRGMHPGRTVAAHLRGLARSNGIDQDRVGEVLDITGVAAVAGMRAKGLSLGMAQRVGIAAALLGDPDLLILDEPVNGLDPEGIRWIRTLIRTLADDGRTVLVSSHLMGEVALSVDHLIVIGRGQLLADVGVAEFVAQHTAAQVMIRTPDPIMLTAVLTTHGIEVFGGLDGVLRAADTTVEVVGEIAARHQIVVHGLRPHEVSLEDAFINLTGASVDHRGRPEEVRR